MSRQSAFFINLRSPMVLTETLEKLQVQNKAQPKIGEASDWLETTPPNTQTSRRQKYFTGHSVWWRAIFHRTESKFAGPKSLSAILTNKREISLVATFLALANTIILRHAVSSLKKLLARFVSLLLRCLWYAFNFSVVLHSWDPSFLWTSFKRVLVRIQPSGSYCSCIHVCHRTLTKSQIRRVFHC